MRTACIIGCIMIAWPVLASAQEFRFPTTNSHMVVQQWVASTRIEVTYNRPSVKGRAIFGGLVPYGEIWRTGSDAATSIAFSTPVSFCGREIDSGKYELFTIPGKTEWVVILQHDHSQWGAYRYDSSNDVVRATVSPEPLSTGVETFTIGFDDVRNDRATLSILWDNTRIPVPITIDVRSTVIPRLEEALKGEGRRPYFLAAMFYFENNIDIDRAAELIALAIKANPTHVGMLYRQALILERKGDRQGAIEAATRSLNYAETAGEQLREEYRKLNGAVLERLRQE